MVAFEKLHHGFPVIASATHVSNLCDVGDFDFQGFVFGDWEYRYLDYRSTRLETGERVFTGGTPLGSECPAPAAKVPTKYDLVFCVEGNEIAHQFVFVSSDRAAAMAVHEAAVQAVKLTSDVELIKQTILDALVSRGLAPR